MCGLFRSIPVARSSSTSHGWVSEHLLHVCRQGALKISTQKDLSDLCFCVWTGDTCSKSIWRQFYNYDPWWSLDDHPLVKSGGSWSTSHMPSDRMCSKDPSKMTAVVTAFMFGLWHGPLAAMPAQRAFGDNYDPW